RLQLETSVWNAGDSAVALDGVDVSAPPGWTIERLDPATSPVAPGRVATRRFALTVAADAPRSQPYFLRRPPSGGLYDWTAGPAAHFTATVTNRGHGPATAQVVVTPPAGWNTPPPQDLSFQREDESKSLTFSLAPPPNARPGVVVLRAGAVAAGRRSEGALVL